MKVITKHFGEVEIDESKIVNFENGIYGFEDQKRFIMFYEDEKSKNGICWMQSLDDVDLALPVINPVFWFPEYSPEVADEQILKIGDLKEDDLQLFSVVVVGEKIESMTTNLKAPVLVNMLTKKGIQTIIENDDIYGIRENLYEQMQKMKAGD